jgi:hypothetical protein
MEYKTNKDSRPAETGYKLKEDFQLMISNLPLQMTYEDAAFLCGCSKAQIQRGIVAGDITAGKAPGGKGNRSKRVLTSSLLDWVTKYV